MPREIEPGLHWIYEPGVDLSKKFDLDTRRPDWYEPDRLVYIPQCAYLLEGEDETLLFDTLSPASTEEILAVIDDLVGDRGLDYLVVSHPDVPHAGNTLVILDEHPETRLVAPEYGNDHELYHLDDATSVGEGDSIDLGGLVVDFHEATFPDAPVHVWMSERETETLFPVDWMGFPHLKDDVLTCSDELENGVDVEQFVEFHSRVLFWYQYVDVEKVRQEIGRLIDEFGPEIVAPAHGLVLRGDAVEYMEMMKEVPGIIERRGRVGTLG